MELRPGVRTKFGGRVRVKAGGRNQEAEHLGDDSYNLRFKLTIKGSQRVDAKSRGKRDSYRGKKLN